MDASPAGSCYEDRSVSMGAAHVYSLLLVLPAGALLVAGFVGAWGLTAFRAAWHAALDGFGWTLAALVGGIVLHEALHGLAWALFGRTPWSAIRFGFQWKTLTPYAHCREPMTVRAYRIGAAAPGVVLGLIPAALGLLAGHGLLFLFGFLFTVAAAGDALILWLLRQARPGWLVVDHPDRVGCYLLPPGAAGPPSASPTGIGPDAGRAPGV